MSNDLEKFYEERSSWRGYREEDMRLGKAAKLAGIPALGDVTVLDIGCRDGRLRRFLPQNILYYGIDIAPSFKGDNIRTADINEGTDFETGMFDYVFCIEVLEHTQAPFFILREIHRILKPAGSLILSVPNPYHFKEILWNLFRIKDKQGHIFSWTRQAMMRMAEFASFEVRKIEGTYFHPPLPSRGLLSRSFIYRMSPVNK